MHQAPDGGGGQDGIDAIGAKLEGATRSLAELSKRLAEMDKRERELALAPIAVVSLLFSGERSRLAERTKEPCQEGRANEW